MKEIINNLKDAFYLIIKDPINLTLALVPTVLALIFYSLGIWFVLDHSSTVSSYLQSYFNSSEHVMWITWILAALFAIIFFFLMSWTFLIVVELVSFPFNTMLAKRIELKVTGKEVQETKTRVTFLSSLKTEFKKVIFILMMTVLAFFMNFIPILYPVSFFLLSLLLAVQFLDYSWSRHELSFGECFKDVMSSMWKYFLSGALFLGIVSLPIVNLIVPALATSYFTLTWVRKSSKSLPQKIK